MCSFHNGSWRAPASSVAIRERLAGPVLAKPSRDLAHVEKLLKRLGLGWLVRRAPAKGIWAAYLFINGFLSIALLSVLAVVTGVPFVFPSLGPTAYQLFFSPRAGVSAPRNTLIGHAIGLICGYGAFRLTGVPPFISVALADFDWRLVIAAAVSLAATAALMILLDASHPPAGATTLIVSLGIITRPLYLVIIEIAVFLLVVQAFCFNRLAGLHYPVWRATNPLEQHSLKR